MGWKLALVAIAVASILWATGFDFRGAKDSAVGLANSAAETVTGADFRS